MNLGHSGATLLRLFPGSVKRDIAHDSDNYIQ
jgi:hypothetical protein